MPWYYSDAAIGGLVALLAIIVTVILAARDRYERQLVVIDPTRTRVMFEEGTGKPHRAILSVLSSGNRPTVVRDVKLVDGKGVAFMSYRAAGTGSEPRLPFRLDAPDEKIVTLELTNPDEQLLDHIDVEYLGGKKPIVWPYVRMFGAAAGKSGVSGSLTVGARATDHAEDVLIPAPKSSTAPKIEQLQLDEKATDTFTPAHTPGPEKR